MQPSDSTLVNSGSRRRLQVWYGVLMLIMALFIARLFYLQVMQHDHYRRAALSGQLKQYTIRPERGIIYAHDGESVVPIVLNEDRYTLFADPVYVTDPEDAAARLAVAVGGSADTYQRQLKTPDTRYVVLAKKLTKEQSRKVDNLKLKGIGTREESYRVYPQNSLAAQLLGFVDDDGKGRYGLEQALDDNLRGKNGLLKAITDARGVPLVANKDNVEIAAKPGSNIVLTIDAALQRQLEDILKQGLDIAKSTSGSALIMDPRTGAIKAVANYPTFDPAVFSEYSDASVFSNNAFSAPLEPGSVMKPFTAGAALEQGVVTASTSYYDPSFYKIGDATVTNIEEDGGAGTRDVKDILQLSLNTGAVWLLRQMGGGDLNLKARQTWHSYMSAHYRFGQPTGVENYEVSGVIPDPVKGDGLNIQYANTSFGQGMTVTPLQLGAALSALINGGTYYQPRLVDKLVDQDGVETVKKPKVIRERVVSPAVSQEMRNLMQYVVDKNNRSAVRAGYQVGGKTGTAQIPKPGGGYYDDRFNGMYIGFVGGNMPEYVIVVRVNEPHIAGYAGARAAGPIFSSLSSMLINNFGVTPKTGP